MNNYESKYKEAFERARKIHEYSSDLAEIKRMEHIFPELAESEDERIRKDIINTIERYIEHVENENCVPDAKDFLIKELKGQIDWLEKQGQKSADKVEPKFHEGDWVIGRVTDNEPRQIAEITEEGYKTTYDGWIGFSFEEDIHLWTIQDAKDGDVLACENGWTCIFNCLHDNIFDSYCFMDAEGWFCKYGGKAHTLDNRICGEIHPATKEQRDILFQKMKESGYKWNPEKKELNLLITNGGDFFESENCEQKPSWSDVDEADLNNIIWLCNNCINGSEITWIPSQAIRIKSLIERIKDTIFLQPKQEWSEEDEKMLSNIVDCIKNLPIFYESININGEDKTTEQFICNTINWLKSLKQRIRG